MGDSESGRKGQGGDSGFEEVVGVQEKIELAEQELVRCLQTQLIVFFSDGSGLCQHVRDVDERGTVTRYS